MTSLNIEVEKFKKKFFIERLNNEINNIEPTSDRYNELKKILDQLTHTDVSLNSLNSLLDSASNDMYKKKWNKLSNYHRTQKIKEYLNDEYEQSNELTELEKKLLGYVTNGKLSSCKNVIYNADICKIEKIIIDKNEQY